MTRSAIREEVFKLLFRADFYDDGELKDQARLFVEGEIDEGISIPSEDEDYIISKFLKIVLLLPTLDDVIDSFSNNWKSARMAKADLTILRLAVYEIRYEDDIPDKVSVNEAVELAKKYGTDNSSSFVNGVLSAAMK